MQPPKMVGFLTGEVEWVFLGQISGFLLCGMGRILYNEIRKGDCTIQLLAAEPVSKGVSDDHCS